MGANKVMEKKTVYIPRFRGDAYQEGTAWKWELLITIGGGAPTTDQTIRMTAKTVFISKAAALQDLEKILPGIVKQVCQAMGLPEPTAFHDLNSGTLEKIEDWKVKNETTQ